MGAPMKVIKNINNNVSLCVDSSGREVIAFGKGIGFRHPPYEISLSQVDRTFYNIDPVYLSMIGGIPEEIMSLSARVVDYARLRLETQVNSNIVVTLADHIHFAIERNRKHMNLTLPIAHDVRHLFKTEMDIGEKTLVLLHRELGILLPEEEAVYIALHIVNGEYSGEKQGAALDEEMIRHITRLIENHFGLAVDRKGFDYSRFVTHMYYLFRRTREGIPEKSENHELFQLLKNSFPSTFACCESIGVYLKKARGWLLTEEEYVYLMMHVNRLCAHEDCRREDNNAQQGAP